MKFFKAAALLALALPISACTDGLSNEAQAKDNDKKWDVAKPPLKTRSVSLDLTEGTWMSLDVSPDGKMIAFDLLGDIYTMPITGGTAKNISSGLPWEYQPRFSHDGKRLAFTSDRGGGDNIWVMDVDGANRQQLTNESFRLLNNPAWSPDDKYIAAKKHFTTARSLGTGEIWLYHLGGGKGVKLVKKPSEAHQKELGEPIFSPDGRYIYYTQNITPGATFQYAQDSNTNLFAINRYDMETGEIDRAVSAQGGSVRPAPSPDGTQIAFVRRERAKSKLYVKDLASGKERKIFDLLDQDMQETWGVQGMYPNMDWTPDSKEIVFWTGGKIWRLAAAGGTPVEIPFRVQDKRQVIDPPRPAVDVSPDTFTTKMPRFASISPDGSTILFETLGQIYLKAAKTPGQAPVQWLSSKDGKQEMFPSWSRDGKNIAYVTWDDEGLGTVMVAQNAGGQRALTTQPGHYRRPRFSPNGDWVVFEKGSGGYLLDRDWSEESGVYIMPASGGEMRKISQEGRYPHFGASGDRLFVTMPGEKGSRKLVSMDLNGEAMRTHAMGQLITQFQVAPDGEHLAFAENYQAYVMPMTPGPQEVGAGISASSLPVVKVSGDGATYMHWSDAQTVNWSLGPQFYSAKVSDMIGTAPDDKPAYKAPGKGISLALTMAADRAEGLVALTGARIITMAAEDGGVIEDGTIIISQNRISAIGAAGDVSIPAGATSVDLAGKTIIPGLIDAHAHGAQGIDDIIPDQNWSAIGHLALGVTTIHDPSSSANTIFPAAERQRAGMLLSPRIYSTGEIVYGAKSATRYAQIDSFEDAAEHVRRLKMQGAHSIKNYNQPRRDQRQQVVAAAIEEDIAVVAEGGSLYHMDMALIADGNTSLEHNLPQSQLYEDVLSFYAATKVAYVPTLVVTYGGQAGDPYWRQATDVWLHPILSRHVPPHILQASSVRRLKAPEEDYADQVSAATAKKLADRGVSVSIGAHGQEEGLAAHWEMWSFARGGMSPLEALGTATREPAAHLGFDDDIGTLEVGKLADLVVLSENPLDDIRNSDKVEHVMLGGRLYEAASMNEVHTGTKARKAYYWE